MRCFVSAPSLVCTFALLCALAMPSCTTEAKENAVVQAVVDDTAKKNPDILRLTVHCSTAGGKDLVAIASTLPARINKPSDPEDLQAVQSGQPVVRDEPNALDVSVPVLQKDGKHSHVVGVTLKAPPDANKDAVKAKAIEIANSVATAISAKK
jgi:hypothetical protein